MDDSPEGSSAVSDNSWGLRAFLKANPFATPEQKQELIKSYLLNYGKQGGGVKAFPGGLVPGAPFVLPEPVRNPGPKGFEDQGTVLNGQFKDVSNTIEDIEMVDAQDGVPEISKIKYTTPKGVRMIYDPKTNNLSFNPEVKADWGKVNPKTGNVRTPLNMQDKVQGTDRNPFKHPVKYVSELMFGPDENTVSDQTLPFSSKWTPEENQSFQQTGQIPAGRDARDLNGTAYQPWVNRSSLNPEQSPTIQNNGILDAMWGSNLNPAGLAQRALNAPADFVHNGQPLQLGLGPDAFIPSVSKPQPAYDTNALGQGYTNQPQSHTLLTPFKRAADDSTAMSVAKGLGNIPIALGQTAGGLAEFLTSPLGLATMGSGAFANTTAKGAVSATEGLAAARAGLTAATAPAEIAAAEQTLAAASRAAQAAQRTAAVNQALQVPLQGKFAWDLGHGAYESGKNAVDQITGQVPVYNKEGGGYQNRGTADISAASFDASNALMNAMFAGQIGAHTLGAGKAALKPEATAVNGAMQNALTLPTEGQVSMQGRDIGDYLFSSGLYSSGLQQTLGDNFTVPPTAQPPVSTPTSAAYNRGRAILSNNDNATKREITPEGFVPPKPDENRKPWEPSQRGQGELPLPQEYQQFADMAGLFAQQPVDRENLMAGPTGRARGRGVEVDPKVAAEAARNKELGLKPGEPKPETPIVTGVPSAAEKAATTAPNLVPKAEVAAPRAPISDREYDVANALRLGTDFMQDTTKADILDGGAVIDPRNVDVPEFAAAKLQGLITPYKKANGVQYWKYTEKGLDMLEQQMEMDGWEVKWKGTEATKPVVEEAPAKPSGPVVMPLDVITNLRPLPEYTKVLQNQLKDIYPEGSNKKVTKENAARAKAIREKLKEITSAAPEAATVADVVAPEKAPVAAEPAKPAVAQPEPAKAPIVSEQAKPLVAEPAASAPVRVPETPPVSEAAPLIDIPPPKEQPVPTQPKVAMEGPTARTERGVRTGQWQQEPAAAQPQTRQPSPSGQNRVRPPLAKPQFSNRGLPILSAKQMFEKNNGQLHRLTYSHLKDLYEETVADPAHNPKFASRIKDEMANRENRFKDSYSTEQEGKNAISGGPVETMTDAQLKDIVDNGVERIRAQREIVAGHNRGDYRKDVRERSKEGEDAIRELNRLRYELEYARREQNIRTRVNAGIARPDGSRIVASKERQLTQTRIDPVTGEERAIPKEKRKPVEALNHARGRFDKLSLDELIAAEAELRKQGRGYADKVAEAVKARLKEGDAVHRRLHGKEAENIPNPRTASREQIEGRIPDLKDEISKLESEIAEQRKSGNPDPATVKRLSEARGDLSAFEKELANRDALEGADIRYEANKNNFKQVSGDIQGTGKDPKKGNYVPRTEPRPVEPKPEPIVGREKPVIQAEGSAAYEAEQRTEASTPKPKNDLGLQGQGRDASPITSETNAEKSAKLKAEKEIKTFEKLKSEQTQQDIAYRTPADIIVNNILDTYGIHQPIPNSKGVQALVDKLKAKTGKDYEVVLTMPHDYGIEARISLGIREVGSFRILAKADASMEGMRGNAVDVLIDYLNTEPEFRKNGAATALITQVLKLTSEELRKSNPEGGVGRISLDDISEGGASTKALRRATGEKVIREGETERLGSFNQNKDYSRGSSDMPAPDTNNYPGLAFSEADVRRWDSQTPAERRAFVDSLPDKRNKDEYYIILEGIRQQDFDNRPGAAERRARQDARKQALMEKYKAEGHPYPELAAEAELNPKPTGPDPEAAAEEAASRRMPKRNMRQVIDLEDNGRGRTSAERKRFVANEAVYMKLSESQRRLADTIARGGNTVRDILRQVVAEAKADKTLTSSMTKMAELLLKNSDQKSLDKIVEMNKDRFLQESYYQGSAISGLSAITGDKSPQSMYGKVSFSQLHLSDPKDLMRVIMHEFVHATTADKVNRAIFGNSSMGNFKTDVFGQTGQKYIDRLRAYARDPNSDKSIAKVAQAYLKYLSTLESKGDIDTRPITRESLDSESNNQTGENYRGNLVGQGIDTQQQSTFGQYRVTNLHEFMSAAMTEKDFQAELSKIKMGNTDMWSKFKDAIADIVGIAPSDSVLRHTFDGVMEISTKDLSEIKKPGASYMSNLADVRTERNMSEGMNAQDARDRAMAEIDPRNEDAFGFGKQNDQSLRTPADIRADIEAILADERRNATSKDVASHWRRKDKLDELYAELNRVEDDLQQNTLNHPRYKEALRNVEDNNIGVKYDTQDTNDAVAAEIDRLEGIDSGNYDANKTGEDRIRFYERSRRSEASLGEELRKAREKWQEESGYKDAKKLDEQWDSMPPEFKAKVDYDAYTSTETFAEQLSLSDNPEKLREDARRMIAEQHGIDPSTMLENNGKPLLSENKTEPKVKDNWDPMTDDELDSGFEQQDYGSKGRRDLGLEGQGRDSSKIGDFARKEAQASVNRANEAIELVKKFSPESKLDAFHRAADIITVSALTSGQAHIDKLASREPNPVARKAITTINDLLMGGRAGEMGRAVKNGYHSKVKSENNRLNNKLNNAIRPLESRLEGLSTKEQAALLEDIGRAVVSQSTHADPQIAQAVTAIRELYKDMYYLQKNAGIDFKNAGPTYIPRMLNTEAVLKDRQGFVNAAARAYETTGLDPAEAMDAANAWWYNIQRGYEGFAHNGKDFIFDAAANNGEPSHVRDRKFNQIAESFMEPYYNRNIMDATRQYIGRAVKASQLAERFGPDFGRYNALQQDILDFGKKGDRLVGEVNETVKNQLAPQVINSSTLRVASDAAAVYQSVRFLPRAVISSLGEPIVGAMRTGQVMDAAVMMGNSVQQSIRQAFHMNPDYHTKLAEEIGAIQSILSDSAISSSVDSRMIDTVSGPLSKRLQNGFFRTTGLHQWTEGTRVASVKLGERFIRRLALDIESGGRSRELSARYLTELGIDSKDHAGFVKFIKSLEGLDENARLKAITDPKSRHAEAYRDSLVRFGEQVIMDPNRGNKARWANHPVGNLIFGLQSYLYAFNENVVKRTLKTTAAAVFNADNNNMSASNRTMLLAPAMLSVPFMAFQYFQGYMRDQYLSDPSRANDEEMSFGNKIGRMLSRAAAFGRYDFLFNVFGGFKYDKDPATAAAGPVIGNASTFLKDKIGLYKDTNSPETNTAERRSARGTYDSILAPAGGLAASLLPGVVGRGLGTALTYAVNHPATRESYVESQAGPPVAPKKKTEKQKENQKNLIDLLMEGER